MRSAYYNEHDLYAAQWLRNLIAAGHIAPGDVDTRSIEDVHPDDLRPYTQCHFFAEIGVWSLALRRAGWPDDREIWSGSCPCQPFSAAGQGAAFADERHLWPAFFHLITQHRPAIVVGEQVASRDADAWIDLVQADMEALGHAFGAVAFPSAGVGAPHIRDRTYWMADANGGARRKGSANEGCIGFGRIPCGASGADAGETAQRAGIHACGLADAECAGVRACRPGCADSASGALQGVDRERQRVRADVGAGDDGVGARPGPVNGFWRVADWLGCRDGKWRPVEPGTSPLAHGAAARVGRLRAYGNAINVEAARVFIQATGLV